MNSSEPRSIQVDQVSPSESKSIQVSPCESKWIKACMHWEPETHSIWAWILGLRSGTSKDLQRPPKTSKNLQKPPKTSKNLQKPPKTSKDLQKTSNNSESKVEVHCLASDAFS